MESLEDAASILRRDAVAIVADHEDGDKPLDLAADLHVAALLRELQGVRDEVREDLLHAPPVAGGGAETRRERRREPDPAVDRDRQQARRDLAPGLRDGEWPQLQVDRPGLDRKSVV